MKESIRIKNLGPLKDVELHDISPLTVIIGESGAGKSLLMKTLILFRYIYKMLNIRWYLRNANVKKSRFKLSMNHLLTPELRQYFKNKQLEVEYKVEVNGNCHYVIYRNGAIDRKVTEKTIPNTDLIFLKECWISEMRNMIPAFTDSPMLLKRKNSDYYFQETLNDFMEASEEISDLNLSYLNMEFKVEKKGDKRKFIISPTDNAYGPMEWKFASSGVQTSSSIPLLVKYFVSAFSFRDAINRSIISYLYQTDSLREYKPQLEPMDMRKIVHIHIEEPELNLFPTAQCELLKDVVKTAFNSTLQDRSLSIIMATHSPYIVNYLNVLINQKNEEKAHLDVSNLGVYRLFNGSLQSLVAKDENGRSFVNSYDLVEQMEIIMQEYQTLTDD